VVNTVTLAVDEEPSQAITSDWHIRPISEGQVKTIGQRMHVLRSTVPDTRAIKALYTKNLEISRSLMPAEVKPNLHESASKVEDAIRRWRADISKVEEEDEEYVLPEKVISILSLQTGLVDVTQICKEALNGYIPSFVEAYHDKIA
jgi:hypothetical protein